MSGPAGGASALADLTARVLEREGAVVEWLDPLGIEVLAPVHLQAALGVPELGRLAFGADPPAGAERVGLESEFVDRLRELLGDRGRHALVVGTAENPRPRDPERTLEAALSLENATHRLLAVRPDRTAYLIPTFRWVARSDDQREGLVSFAVNSGTGSLSDEVAPLTEASAYARPASVSTVPSLPPERLADIAARALPARVEGLLAPFLRGMERRLQRDAGRLLDYHGRLRDEALSRFARERDRGEEGGSEDSALREGQRLAAIAREHAAKLDDLRTRYAVSVEIEWVQTLELLLPVQRFEVEIRRRKKTRTIALDLNACTRQLEMPACEYRYSGDRLRVVCDEALHLVGREGFAPCRHCQRPACRVCHLAGCPRCGRRW